MVSVPTVVGMTQHQAQVALEKAGLEVGDVHEAQSNRAARRGDRHASRRRLGGELPSTRVDSW